MVTGILQILFNTTDSAIVGKYVDDNGLAAVSSTAIVYNMFINFFMGVSIGSNVLIAQYFGSRRAKDIEETISTSLLISAILGVFTTGVGMIFAGRFLTLMNVPPEVFDQATLYLRIIFIGAPVQLIYNFSAAIMRATGDTSRPMWFLMAAVVANVLLDFLFVGAFRMGVYGAALATVISRGAAAVLAVIALIRGKGIVRLRFSGDRKFFSLQKAKKLFAIGVPAGFQSLLFSIGNLIIQATMNTFGNVALAGLGAGYQIECIIYAVVESFNYAGLNISAQNAGAGKRDRIRKGVFINCTMSFLIGGILGSGVYLFGNSLLKLFTDSPAAIEYGMKRTFYMCLPYALVGVMESMAGSVRGLGASITPTIITLTAACILRVVWTKLIFPMDPTLDNLLVVYPISQALTSAAQIVAFIIFYHRTKKRPMVITD